MLTTAPQHSGDDRGALALLGRGLWSAYLGRVAARSGEALFFGGVVAEGRKRFKADY